MASGHWFIVWSEQSTVWLQSIGRIWRWVAETDHTDIAW